MNRLSSFSDFALTMAEMRKVKGGDCMPAHWDVYVDGQLSLCALTYSGAWKYANTSEKNGGPSGKVREVKFRESECY